jgi:nitrogen fixation/metabolism regulation signal transduction histidine kinase
VGRKPFLDNTKLILIGIVALIAALAGFLVLANRASAFAPDVLAEFVLYALFATNLTMLLALLFVLARNVIKLVVEQRKAIPFARFRTRLVMALLGMTLIPAVLVLIVGSELIRNNIDRFFNAPMATMLSSARDIASDYYRERQRVVSSVAQRLARRVSGTELTDDPAARRDRAAAGRRGRRVGDPARLPPRRRRASGAAGGAVRPRRGSRRAAGGAERRRSRSHGDSAAVIAPRTGARCADCQ